jgi:hydroxymethylbilane synthase
VAERPLRLGTRGSALALAQANAVAKSLGGAEVVPIKTSDNSSEGGGDKSRFVREIELALLDGEVDLGVHSAKDLPTELAEGLQLAGVPEREDPRDAFVGHVDSLGEVPEGARIGTSSLRRRAQILALRPDLAVTEVRGNVDTRLDRLEAGDYDGLVLAAAGLRRLGRAEEIAFEIEPDQLAPAPGQGTIAIEARRSKDRSAGAAESVTDRGALATLLAERALVAALDASCNTPLGALATIQHDGRMRIHAFCGLPDGSEWLRDEIDEDDADPESVGHALAERMKAAGASDILERAESMAETRGGSDDARARDSATRSKQKERPVSR